jgi:hypothetical protein
MSSNVLMVKLNWVSWSTVGMKVARNLRAGEKRDDNFNSFRAVIRGIVPFSVIGPLYTLENDTLL